MEGLWGSSSSQNFTLVIGGFFVFSCVFLIKRSKIPFITEHAPGILTTLGLFGTFWGVAQGLGTFDVQDIEKSIPELLSGMKLAFWTSILGMSCALVFNIIKYCMGVFSQAQSEGGVSADDIYKVMLDVARQTTDLRMEMHSMNNERNTLLKENFSTIVNEFRDFAAKMSENNSKALIEALKDVMRDFNAKINEQFGDNFKELNKAVGALLQWQENYRQHVETLVSQFELALVGIEKSRAAIEDINNSTSSIPSTMEMLRGLLEKLDYEVGNAQELLKGFVALRTQADEVFPVIQQSLDHLTQDMTQSVLSSTREVESTVTNQSRSLEALAKRISDQAINADNAMRQGLEEIRSVFKKTLDDVEISTKKHYESMDKQMEAELQNAIRILGSKLASLSLKLIEDYRTLTEKITNLVARTQDGQRRS